MNEKQKHKELKEHARNILLKKGFKKKEIKLEYLVKFENNEYMVIDVVGIRPDKTIFIECGNLNQENKLEILKKFCDELIHLPYLKTTRRGTHLNVELPSEIIKKAKIDALKKDLELKEYIEKLINKGL